MDYPVAGILLAAGAAFLVATAAALGLARLRFPVPDESTRMGCVDGLRGYLALSVMMHHFTIWFQIAFLGGSWALPGVRAFGSFGTGGVGLFFMATGFVFYPRILQGWKALNWPALYLTRAFRLLPAMLTALAIISFIILVRLRFHVTAPWHKLPRAILTWLTGSWEPPLFGYPDSGRLNAYVFWSLWYEWEFYILIIPLLAILADLIRGRAPSWLIPVSLVACTYLPFRAQAFMFLPCFAAGMFAYELRARPAPAAILRSPWVAVPVFAALVVAGSLTAFPYFMPQLAVYGLFFACVACGNRFGGVLSNKAALILGEASFSIYLLHGIVLDILFVNILPVIAPGSRIVALAALPLAAACVACTAACVFLLIEKPGIRYGKKLARTWLPGSRRTPIPVAAESPRP